VMDYLSIVLISFTILLSVSVLLIYSIAILSFCFVLAIQITIGILRIIVWIICLLFRLIEFQLSKRDETSGNNINEVTPLLRHQNNMANQLNPNNHNYWRSRGYNSRPDTWQDEVDARNLRGQYEYRANLESTTSDDQRRKMGRDNKRVEKVVKEVCGGNAMVYKGGSQLKRTNVRTSDNDLKINVPYMMTMDDKERLGNALEEEFGIGNVDRSHQKIHVVRGEGGDIDIVPNRAEYYPPDFKFDGLGKNPFSHNKTAKDAARYIKTNNRNVPGIKVEKMVLQVQKENKNIPLEKLIEKTEEQLKLNN